MFVRGIFILTFLFPAVVHAQEMAVGMPQGKAVPEALAQWQTGVDAVRLQMDALMRQHDQLTKEYNEYKAQENNLLRLIEEQRQKNEALVNFLKERHGRTDQDERISVLNDQLRIKRLLLDKTLLAYKTQHATVDEIANRIDQKRSRVSEIELHQGDAVTAPKPAPVDPEIESLKLELAKQREAQEKLQARLNPADMASGSRELDMLQDKLNALLEKKKALMRKPLVSDNGSKDRIYMMQSKKDELEAKIKGFEKRIDVLKASVSSKGSWSFGRKELVREIVQGDARNKKLANEINDLKEDIALLKNQIGVLEKRVLFSNKR